MTTTAAPAPLDIDRYRAAAEICRALTDPKRLALLALLRDGERSAGGLAAALGCPLPNASQHLAVLRNAGLVRGRREGTSVLYRLTVPEIVDACDSVSRLAEARRAAPDETE